MKNILLFLLLLPALLFAQNQGGVIIVGGVAVHQPDTSAYKVINTIQAEGTALSGNNRFYVTYLVALSKMDSLWQKSKAFYGFIGGTSASHKWNWKDMRNLDVAYRLTFPNGATHNSNGVLFNGTDQFANTFLNPTTVFASPKNITMGVYINGGTGTGITVTNTMGSRGSGLTGNGSTNQSVLSIRSSIVLSILEGENSSGSIVVFSKSFSNGFYSNSGNGGKNKIFVNGQKVGEANLGSSNASNNNIYIGAILNETGTFGNPQNVRIPLSIMSEGLTDTQSIQASNIVTFSQGIIGRK